MEQMLTAAFIAVMLPTIAALGYFVVLVLLSKLQNSSMRSFKFQDVRVTAAVILALLVYLLGFRRVENRAEAIMECVRNQEYGTERLTPEYVEYCVEEYTRDDSSFPDDM